MHQGDFRGTLYARYRSGFKGAAREAEPVFGWWDYKYLPLLRGLAPSAAVLDLGCGDGRLLAYLAQRGFSNALGIDVSGEQVAASKQRGVWAEQADAFSWLALHPAAYDLILAVDVFEHLARDELLRLAPLLRDALRPRGRLLVQTANGAGLFAGQVMYGDLTHLTIFTPESLAQLLRPFGFEQLSFYETGPVPLRLRGKLDVALWQAIKLAASSIRAVQAGKRQAIWTDTFICLARAP